MVNNAAVPHWCPAELLPLGDAQAVFDVNVWGHVRVTQTMLPLLRRAAALPNSQSPRIVFISSTAGTCWCAPFVSSFSSFISFGAFSRSHWALHLLSPLYPFSFFHLCCSACSLFVSHWALSMVPYSCSIHSREGHRSVHNVEARARGVCQHAASRAPQPAHSGRCGRARYAPPISHAHAHLTTCTFRCQQLFFCLFFFLIFMSCFIFLVCIHFFH